MKFSANNFLQLIKQIVMGGGYMKDGKAVHNDAGYLHDMNFTLSDLAAEAALTDSTTGSVGTTLAAGAGVATLVIPCTLPAGTGAADVITNYTLGYKFKILSWSFTTDVAGVGSGASRVFNMEIGSTDVGTTPSTVTLTEASTSDVGEQTAGTTVTGANTGAANATFSIEVASGGTAFTAGSGFFTIAVQNMDTADALATLSAAVTSTASETNLLVNSYPASTTFTGSFTFVVPRDYDEATDTLRVHIGAASAGSTDTPTLTASGYYKRPGSSVATLSASKNGTTLANAEAGVTTVLALSTADQLVVFDFSKLGLKRDDAVTIKFTASAHTTDAILVYFVEPVYRSTLVSYHESDGSPRDGKTGSFLR